MKSTLKITASVTHIAMIAAYAEALQNGSAPNVLSTTDLEVDVIVSNETGHTPMVAPETPIPIVETAPEIPTVTPGAPVPAISSNVELDSNGIPWDERIHGSSKAKNKDGSWRRRRNLDDAVYNSVLAELKANAAPPMPAGDTAQPVTPVAQPEPTPVIPAPVVSAPVEQQQPTPPMPAGDTVQPVTPVAQPVAPTPPPVETTAQPQAGVTFGEFMQVVTNCTTSQPQTFNTEYLQKITSEIATAFQTEIPAITAINGSPGMIDYAHQLLKRDGFWPQ